MQALVVKLEKYVYAQLTSVAAVGTFQFNQNNAKDISNANIVVYAFEGISAAEASVDMYGNTLIPSADSPKVSFSWMDKGGNLLLENFSFYRSRVVNSSGFPVYVDDFAVDLTKSLVSLNQTGGTLATNQVVGFQIYYRFIK